MTLLLSPCQNKAVLAHVPPEFRKVMKAGSATLAGKHYPLCWMVNPAAVVIAVYEDGDFGDIPVEHFRPAQKPEKF